MKPVDNALPKLRLFAMLYVLLGFLIGFAFTIPIHPALAYVLVGIFFLGYIINSKKVKKITKTWITIRGLHIEANKTARDVYQENKEYILDIVPWVTGGAFFTLVWLAPSFPLLSMYAIVHTSALGFLVSLLDWKHDQVHAKEYRSSRRKERADDVDLLLDWPAKRTMSNSNKL